MIATSRHWFRTFALWLSLAIVLTCAIGSFGSPVRASSGSAFNAFTSDVAIGPKRAGAPEKDSSEQTPAPGGSGQAKALPASLIALFPPSLSASISGGIQPQVSVLPLTAGPVGARAPPLS